MEIKDSEEIAKKLRALERSTIKNGIKTGFKYGMLLFLANAIVVLVGMAWLQSQAFCFFGGVMNAIFILPAMARENKKEHDRVREEAKKILQQ